MNRYMKLVALVALLTIGALQRDTAAATGFWWSDCYSECLPGGTKANWCSFDWLDFTGGPYPVCDPDALDQWEDACEQWAGNDGSPYSWWFSSFWCDDGDQQIEPYGEFYCSWPNAWSCQ